MKRPFLVSALALLGTAAVYLLHGPGVLAAPSPLNCNLSGYQGASGLTATAASDSVVVTWDGDRNQELRLRFVIDNGTPTIAELAARKKGGAWGTLASNVTPEFRVVSGRRRMDTEAQEGLRENGITEITPEVFEKYQWDPFWDAPLNIPGTADMGRTLGLPRSPEEVHRGTSTYQMQSCEVKTDGTRLSVNFPGLTMGVFSSGQLEFTIYKGSNLIRQEAIAKTNQNSVPYKYAASVQ